MESGEIKNLVFIDSSGNMFSPASGNTVDVKFYKSLTRKLNPLPKNKVINKPYKRIKRVKTDD